MCRERSQDSLVSIHFWRGVLGNGCPDSTQHGRIASPNALLLRKRRPETTPLTSHPNPSQPSTVSSTYTLATAATAVMARPPTQRDTGPLLAEPSRERRLASARIMISVIGVITPSSTWVFRISEKRLPGTR